MKTGQISLYIVLGLLLLVFVGLFTIQRSFFLPPRVGPSDAVRHFIESCFSQSAINAVVWFYAMDPERVFFPLLEDDGSTVWWPVWYDNGKIRIPEDVSLWVSRFAVAAQGRCTKSFASFPGVKELGREVKVTTVPTGVLLTLNQPVRLESTGTRDLTEPYEIHVGLHLQTFIDVAHGLLQQVQQHPDYIPLKYIVDQEQQHHIKITYAYLDGDGHSYKNIVVYQLLDINADPKMKRNHLKFIARMSE